VAFRYEIDESDVFMGWLKNLFKSTIGIEIEIGGYNIGL
jgi:hypothetical protein